MNKSSSCSSSRKVLLESLFPSVTLTVWSKRARATMTHSTHTCFLLFFSYLKHSIGLCVRRQKFFWLHPLPSLTFQFHNTPQHNRGRTWRQSLPVTHFTLNMLGEDWAVSDIWAPCLNQLSSYGGLGRRGSEQHCAVAVQWHTHRQVFNRTLWSMSNH